MIHDRFFWRIPVVLLFCCWLAAALAPAAETEATNNGQDFTRPLTRFDIRYEYQNTPGSKNDNMNIMT